MEVLPGPLSNSHRSGGNEGLGSSYIKTQTMVSMETQVVSRDLFLDKFSEKTLPQIF